MPQDGQEMGGKGREGDGEPAKFGAGATPRGTAQQREGSRSGDARVGTGDTELRTTSTAVTVAEAKRWMRALKKSGQEKPAQDRTLSGGVPTRWAEDGNEDGGGTQSQ